MKITKNYLKQIIKEELEKLVEGTFEKVPDSPNIVRSFDNQITKDLSADQRAEIKQKTDEFKLVKIRTEDYESVMGDFREAVIMFEAGNRQAIRFLKRAINKLKMVAGDNG
jgi:pyruvate/oxaloacetate carboxyltransferase